MAVYRIVLARSEYKCYEVEAGDVDEAIELIDWPEDEHEWEVVEYEQKES